MSGYDIWQDIKHQIEGRLIHRTEDHWGEILVVDNGSRRMLLFDAPYEQSCIDLDAPHRLVHEYARAMLLVLAFSQPNDVVLLGLGGGSLVHALNRMLPETRLHIVELRQKVLDIARDYFSIPVTGHTTFTIDDARMAVRNLAPESTDIIFADLFHAAAMHELQRQKKFISHCQRCLRPDGWLVVNFDQLEGRDDAALDVLCDLFPTILLCTAHDGNQIVLAGMEDLYQMPDPISACSLLEQQLEMPFQPLFVRLQRL